ncbi:MAG: hypothetical protein SCH71_06545 [Desulfobulbaceae bacterium]|nr:hypothetical protein [Desulfobulbaceae bacterium]
MDQIFQNAFTLTGGIATDATTLIGCIILIGFIMVGIDILFAHLGQSFQNTARNKYLKRSEELYNELYPGGDFERFRKQKAMHRYLNKADRF